MGRPKGSKNKPKVNKSEETSPFTTATGGEEESHIVSSEEEIKEVTTIKKSRGRPKGSKNIAHIPLESVEVKPSSFKVEENQPSQTNEIDSFNIISDFAKSIAPYLSTKVKEYFETLDPAANLEDNIVFWAMEFFEVG